MGCSGRRDRSISSPQLRRAYAVPTQPEGAEVKRSTTRSGLTLAVLAALLALGLVLVPAAVAGKGSGASGAPSGTISLVPLSPSTDGLLHYGQQVTFDVYASSTAYPWVLLECTQGGSLVYRHQTGIFPTSLMQVFTLGLTPAWTGGAADCTAYLQDRGGRKIKTLASLTFYVYA